MKIEIQPAQSDASKDPSSEASKSARPDRKQFLQRVRKLPKEYQFRWEEHPDPKLLWEEYKLLQDKIDKVGAFRYQIKGWLIPLISAWLAAIYTAHITPWAYIIGTFFPVLFWLLEKNHDLIQKGLIRRILTIEDVILKKDIPAFFGPKPIIKNDEIAVARANRQPLSPAEAIEVVESKLKNTCLGWFVLHAHGLFYVSVGVLVVLITLMAVSSNEAVTKRTDLSVPDMANALKIPDLASQSDFSHSDLPPSFTSRLDLSHPDLMPSSVQPDLAPSTLPQSRQHQESPSANPTVPRKAKIKVPTSEQDGVH